MNNVKNSIGWADYTWNPVKGICPLYCNYCYARRIYNRFKLNSVIRFDEKTFSENFPKTPSRIFVGSTIELFCNEIEHLWVGMIIARCKYNPIHTFIFLTKKPFNLVANYVFPENCWIGVSITGEEIGEDKKYYEISGINNKKILCIEPFIKPVNINDFFSYTLPDWIIIGGLTPKNVHQKNWVDGIVIRAREKGIPLFLKDNLHYDKIIKEYPNTNTAEIPTADDLISGDKKSF